MSNVLKNVPVYRQAGTFLFSPAYRHGQHRNMRVIHRILRDTSEHHVRQALPLVGGHYDQICIANIGSNQNGIILKEGSRGDDHIGLLQTSRFGQTIFFALLLSHQLEGPKGC